jgi:hypothetical protein
MIQLGFIIWLRLEAETYLLWNIYWEKINLKVKEIRIFCPKSKEKVSKTNSWKIYRYERTKYSFKSDYYNNTSVYWVYSIVLSNTKRIDWVLSTDWTLEKLISEPIIKTWFDVNENIF